MNTEQLKELNLELLTERQKDAVLMALEGKSQTEIGKLMGVTKQNVSALIKKAIERNSRSKTKECPKHHTGKGVPFLLPPHRGAETMMIIKSKTFLRYLRANEK